MEKIKFRCFNKKTKKMRDSESLRNMGSFALLSVYSSQDFLVLPYPQDDYILMQYTGLKDKNGVEIYAGDLINLGEDNNCLIVGKVVYNESDFGVPCYCIEDKEGSFQPFFAKDDFTKTWFEVIGNIYENHELLEAQSEV